MEVHYAGWGEKIRLINQNIRALVIHNLGAISNDQVAKAELSKKKHLNSLTVR
jgi:hypothetical protein